MNYDLEIYNLFKKHGIKVPESARFSARFIHSKDWYEVSYIKAIKLIELKELYGEDCIIIPIYSTDELIDRILPPQINQQWKQGNVFYNFIIEVGRTSIYVGYQNFNGNDYRGELVGFMESTINQALKQLLIWALQNYPEQVKEWIERA
jgi:hypothetical protein